MSAKNNLSGLTLIEMLIALLLIVILSGVVFAIYEYLQVNDQRQQNLFSAIEESAEISYLLRQQIHQAGFVGCAKLSADFPLRNHTHLKLDKKITPLFNDGSDGLSVWHAEDHAMLLAKAMENEFDLQLNVHYSLHADAVLIISDCKSADVFTINSMTDQGQYLSVHTSQALSKLYDTHAEIFLLVKKSFYLSHSALLVEDLHHNKIELARDVSKIQVTYFIDDQIQKSSQELLPNDVIRAVNILV